MESTSEPTSPMAAAASDKRKFRTCSNCTSRMPSIDFDAHTLCIGCRHQVCDLTVYCDECSNWPGTYRSAFVKYCRTLKAKHDYKGRRKARLSGAAQSPSDQSVYDTDTEVPSLDEPLPSVQVQSDIVECVVSQQCVVSEAPSTEAGPSDILYVTSGDRFEQLASSLLSKMSELQSDRGRHPPVQSHSIVGSGSRLIVAASDYLGVSAPLRGFIYLTLLSQFSGSPQRLCLTKPLFIGYSLAIASYRSWRRTFLIVWRSARFAIGAFSPLIHSWIRLRPSPGNWKMRSGRLRSYVGRFAPFHHSLGFRHISSDLPLLRLSSQVLHIQKATLHPLVHLGDGPMIPLRVLLDVHLARGVILLPTGGVGSRTIHLPMRANRLQVADNGTISRKKRRIFVLLLWLSYLTTS